MSSLLNALDDAETEHSYGFQARYIEYSSSQQQAPLSSPLSATTSEDDVEIVEETPKCSISRGKIVTNTPGKGAKKQRTMESYTVQNTNRGSPSDVLRCDQITPVTTTYNSYLKDRAHNLVLVAPSEGQGVTDLVSSQSSTTCSMQPSSSSSLSSPRLSIPSSPASPCNQVSSSMSVPMDTSNSKMCKTPTSHVPKKFPKTIKEHLASPPSPTFPTKSSISPRRGRGRGVGKGRAKKDTPVKANVVGLNMNVVQNCFPLSLPSQVAFDTASTTIQNAVRGWNHVIIPNSQTPVAIPAGSSVITIRKVEVSPGQQRKIMFQPKKLCRAPILLEHKTKKKNNEVVNLVDDSPVKKAKETNSKEPQGDTQGNQKEASQGDSDSSVSNASRSGSTGSPASQTRSENTRDREMPDGATVKEALCTNCGIWTKNLQKCDHCPHTFDKRPPLKVRDYTSEKCPSCQQLSKNLEICSECNIVISPKIQTQLSFPVLSSQDRITSFQSAMTANGSVVKVINTKEFYKNKLEGFMPNSFNTPIVQKRTYVAKAVNKRNLSIPPTKRKKKPRKTEPELICILDSDDEDDKNTSTSEPPGRSDPPTESPTPTSSSSPAAPETPADSNSGQDATDSKPAVGSVDVLHLTRRNKMRDEEGNVLSVNLVSQDSVVTEPKKAGDWLESLEELQVEFNLVLLKFGTHSFQENYPKVTITGRKIIFQFDPEIHSCNRVVLEDKDITALHYCLNKNMPSFFIQTTPRFGLIIRERLKMKECKTHFDPGSAEWYEKMICFRPDEGDAPLPAPDIYKVLRELKQNSSANEDAFCEIKPEECNVRLYDCMPPETRPEALKAAAQSTDTPCPDRTLSTVNLDPPASSPVTSTSRVNSSSSFQTILVYPPPPNKGAINITEEDLECLKEGEFLNDVIIEFYLKYLIMEVLPADQSHSTHIFSTFFYKRLTQRDYGPRTENSNLSAAEKRHQKVKKWTRNVDLFEKDFIIIPINESAHWYVAIVCFPGRVTNNNMLPSSEANASRSSTPLSNEETEDTLPSNEDADNKALVKQDIDCDSNMDSTLNDSSSDLISDQIFPDYSESCESSNVIFQRTFNRTQGIEKETTISQKHFEKEGEPMEALENNLTSDIQMNQSCQDDEKDKSLDVNYGLKKFSPYQPKDSLSTAKSIKEESISLAMEVGEEPSPPFEDDEHSVLMCDKAVQTKHSLLRSLALKAQHKDKLVNTANPPTTASAVVESPIISPNVDAGTSQDSTVDSSSGETPSAEEGKASKARGNKQSDQDLYEYWQQQVCHEQPCILIMDSLKGPTRRHVIQKLREYLEEEWISRKHTPLKFTTQTIRGATVDVPQQNNFSDCGVYVLEYVEKFFKRPLRNYRVPIKGLSKWFSQDEVKTKREKIRKLILVLRDMNKNGI